MRTPDLRQRFNDFILTTNTLHICAFLTLSTCTVLACKPTRPELSIDQPLMFTLRQTTSATHAVARYSEIDTTWRPGESTSCGSTSNLEHSKVLILFDFDLHQGSFRPWIAYHQLTLWRGRRVETVRPRPCSAYKLHGEETCLQSSLVGDQLVLMTTVCHSD